MTRINSIQLRIRAIVTGRELNIQSSAITFNKIGQTINILPYFISTDELENYNYHDPQKVFIGKDLRRLWWEKYAELTGSKFYKMPKELQSNKFIEITSQPLLNHLIAISYSDGKLDFSKEQNLNTIYKSLVESVYERGYADHRHISVKKIDLNDFMRILEEIGIATWQGDGRTTTIAEIYKRCEACGITKLLDDFQTGAEAGVTSLLTAFYFRHAGHTPQGDNTYEFTHKSFGEYFTSCRIIREIRLINRKMHEKDIDDKWLPKNSLLRWIRLCRMNTMDQYLFEFLKREISLIETNLVLDWQKDIAELISYSVKYGMPLEEITPRSTFNLESTHAKNCEEALLSLHYACALKTKVISDINWPFESSLNDLMSRLESQKIHDNNNLTINYFDYLNNSGQISRKSILNSLMLDSLVHDLKNPLQCICGSIEMLYEQFNTTLSPIQERLFKTAESGTHQMQMLIGNIIGISGFEKGSIIAVTKPFNIVEAINEMVKMYDNVDIIFSENIPLMIQSDRDLYIRILMNLVSNALRFSAIGHRITISCEYNPVNRILNTSVVNQGSYIDDKNREAIFNKYVSVQRSVGSLRGQNYGLGLTFSKIAVQALDGDIWVESSKEKNETTFNFKIRDIKST